MLSSHSNNLQTSKKNTMSHNLISQLRKTEGLTVEEETHDDETWGACFSLPSCYRYSLWRLWGKSNNVAVGIFLNPSIATHRANDHTVRKFGNWARKNGYSGIFILNVFGIRGKDPRVIKEVHNPVGNMNDRVIKMHIDLLSGVFIGGWGNDGRIDRRSDKVRRLLNKKVKCFCFCKNKNGEPSHPAYKSLKKLEKL